MDNYGKKLQGCTSSTTKTWVEWKIEESIAAYKGKELSAAQSRIKKAIEAEIKQNLREYTDEAVQEKVSSAINAILKKGKKCESTKSMDVIT